ncbi:hypothetical protein H2248_002826 [Termitomyces sp. 'cryptogamus']|nr:hypothetical protein H2248_002826 [Termitomyces sp. 'cryptogamus']
MVGLSIQVYGSIGRDHNNGDPAFAPITMYMIDGQNDSTTMFTGKPGTDILYNQLFYRSPKLSSGQHELVVTLTTSNMNTMWIDYFQVERPATVSPGLIAGAVIGGVAVLLVIIGILLRRISRLKRRRVQYEEVPRKATETYWPWMTRSPGELTPFGSELLSDTRPFNGVLRPFSVHYTPYTPELLEPSNLSIGSLSGYIVRGDTAADKTMSRESASTGYPSSSGYTDSISGYTVRGDTAADKTTSRESTSTACTSLSGYTTRGGTSSDKRVSSLSTTASPNGSSHTNTAGATSHSSRHKVQSTTRTENNDHRSRLPRRKILPPSTGASSDTRSQPSGVTTTTRVVAEGEEVPPAYSTHPRYSTPD